MFLSCFEIQKPIDTPALSGAVQFKDPWSSALRNPYFLGCCRLGQNHLVFRALVGDTVPFSASSIGRMKEVWEQEYTAWGTSPLKKRYTYIFADGIYLKDSKEHEKTVMLVLIGVNMDGENELQALETGYRKSTASWRNLLCSLKFRGMTTPPFLAITDGGLGFWTALGEAYPETRCQRCWNHSILNMIDA